MSLKIGKIDTTKHNIPQRNLMKMGVVPHHPSISLMSGSQGGGKSTLCANLLTNPLMYGLSLEGMEKELKRHPDALPQPYFDAIFLMIGSDDDMYDHLVDQGIIKQNHICHMPTPEDVQKVIDGQKMAIARANGDMLKVPKILFIFDDVVNDGKLMRSKPFLECFVKGRHINSSTWMLTQYLNLCPKALRLQANYLFVFKSNRAELQVLSDQFCPPSMTKKEFSKMVQETTQDDEENKNNFLVICKRAPEDKRFRKNLDKFVTLKRLKYVPKPMPLPPKEIEDLDFDVEHNIKQLQSEEKRRFHKHSQIDEHGQFVGEVIPTETPKQPRRKLNVRRR
jgi:hypothetical protein